YMSLASCCGALRISDDGPDQFRCCCRGHGVVLCVLLGLMAQAAQPSVVGHADQNGFTVLLHGVAKEAAIPRVESAAVIHAELPLDRKSTRLNSNHN